MSQQSLSGRQTVLMDQRGRISFPAAYRAAIGENLFISPDPRFRHFLVVRSQEGFDDELQRIKQECIDNGCDEEDTEDEMRDFAMETVTVPPDKNGRITIPTQLLEYAGLHDKVVVVGNGKNAELWDEAALERYRAERKLLKERRREKKDAEKAARMRDPE